MSDAIHLLIPFATAASPGCQQAWAALPLPALRRLLARMVPVHEDLAGETTLSMPHERALARALGLPAADGCIPWAAWHLHTQHRDPGTASWAWITPCHWAVGGSAITMHPPGQLQLREDESRTLLAAMQPYFEEDGIALTWDTPGRWLAQGEPFHALACASLERVAGATVDDWLPRQPEARGLRRLQQEMQMLLYTHAVNEAREREGGRPVINSFWISGAGALPQPAPPQAHAGLRQDERLREAALRGDWPAWAAAWQAIDTHEMPRLLAALDQGRPVTLTLCGERGARTWVQHPHQGWWLRATSALRAPSLARIFESL